MPRKKKKTKRSKKRKGVKKSGIRGLSKKYANWEQGMYTDPQAKWFIWGAVALAVVGSVTAWFTWVDEDDDEERNYASDAWHIGAVVGGSMLFMGLLYMAFEWRAGEIEQACGSIEDTGQKTACIQNYIRQAKMRDEIRSSRGGSGGSSLRIGGLSLNF